LPLGYKANKKSSLLGEFAIFDKTSNLNLPEKRIAFLITSTGWGGLEMNTLKLASELNRSGFDIILCSQPESTIYSNGKNLFQDCVHINFRKKYFDFKTARNLGKTLKSKGIHTIIVFDNRDLDVISWTKRLYFKSLRIVYQQHMQIGITKKSLFHTLRYKTIDCWISPLHYLKAEIRLRTHYPPSKVTIVPIGFDTTTYASNTLSKLEARKILGIDPKLPLFGIIGRISEKKGQLFVAESIAKINADAPRAEILIVGSATINDPSCIAYEQQLKSFIHENELENCIHMLGHRSDVEVFYAAIDCFILASESETYGMVTLEALASGLPVIATKSGGTSEILKDGDFGTLYKHNDFEEFQRAINAFLQGPDEALQKARKAQDYVVPHYRTAKEVEGICAILEAKH